MTNPKEWTLGFGEFSSYRARYFPNIVFTACSAASKWPKTNNKKIYCFCFNLKFAHYHMILTEALSLTKNYPIPLYFTAQYVFQIKISIYNCTFATCFDMIYIYFTISAQWQCKETILFCYYSSLRDLHQWNYYATTTGLTVCLLAVLNNCSCF